MLRPSPCRPPRHAVFLPDWMPAAAALLILAARYAWAISRGAESRQSIALRRAWAARILAQPGLEIVAVQTLRNSIMAATLMATTATLALMGVLSLGHAQMESAASAMHADALDLGWFATHARLFLPVSLLAACVVLFSKTVRLYHRVGYTLGLPQGTSEQSDIAAGIAAFELTRAAHLYRNGWRAFYGAIATGAWLVSGWMMLATTLVIVAIDIAAKIE